MTKASCHIGQWMISLIWLIWFMIQLYETVAIIRYTMGIMERGQKAFQTFAAAIICWGPMFRDYLYLFYDYNLSFCFPPHTHLLFIKVWLRLLQGSAIRLYPIHRWTPGLYQCETQSALYAADRPTSGFDHRLWPVLTIPVPLGWHRKMGRSQKGHHDTVGPNNQGHQNTNCARISVSLWKSA